MSLSTLLLAASSSSFISLTLSAEAPAVKFSDDGPRVAYFALEQPFSLPFFYKLSDETGCHSAGERSVMQPRICALSSWRGDSAATALPSPFALWRIKLNAGRSFLANASAMGSPG